MSAPIGAASATTTGQVLASTLLVSALPPGTLADVVRDTLLLAQRNKPTATTVTAWLASYGEVLAQVGWVQSGTFSSSSQLRPDPSQTVPTTVPWQTMRVELGEILSGPVPLTTVDGFVRGLRKLTGDALTRWTAATVLGSTAVAAVAVAVPSTDGATLMVLTGWLTYADTVRKPRLTSFPDTAVPATGATLSVAGTVYALGTVLADQLHDQLEKLVTAVLPDVVSVHPLS